VDPVSGHQAENLPRRDAISALRFASVFGSSVVVAQFGQLAWLVTGSRALGLTDFGLVLTAQALYGLLQYAVDNGTAFHGARLAAAGRLDEATRSSIIRARIELAGIAAGVTVLVGLVGGARLLQAVGPFVVALFMFALLTYWDRFGRGEGGPWSAYLVLRAVGPAVAAGGALLAGGELPIFVPGGVECAGIAGVAIAFRLRPVADLRAGLRGSRVAWRASVSVGLPNLAWQIGLLSGPVLLGVAGAAAAAGVLAVGVRLLTGVNQICGVIATSLFRPLAEEGEERSKERLVTLGLQAILAVAAFALAVLLVRPGLFVAAFLDLRNDAAEATAIIALGASGAVAYLLLATMLLVARHHEHVTLRAYGVGSGLSIALGLGIAIVQPGSEALLVAMALLVGQLLNVVLIWQGGVAHFPSLRRALTRAASVTWGLAGVAGIAAALPPARLGCAIALAAVSSFVLVRTVGELRALRGAAPSVGPPVA
jgi:O-antigen/teichoic acid export membrane protein